MNSFMEDDFFGEVIYSYGIKEAEDDGILASTDKLFPHQPQHLVSHITSNLIEKQGYKNGASIIDICNFMGPKIREILGKDSFLSAKAEGPNGNKFEIWAQQNELGRWTLMLPEDY